MFNTILIGASILLLIISILIFLISLFMIIQIFLEFKDWQDK